MTLRVKIVTVTAVEHESFETKLEKALSGLNVKYVSYSISTIADNIDTIKSALIIHDV